MDERDAIIEEARLESGFATLADAQDIIATWRSCPWCLVPFGDAAAERRVSHVGGCAGNENAVRLARAYVRGVAAARRRVTREIEALPGVGRGDHGESLPGGELLPRHLVLAKVGRGVPERECEECHGSGDVTGSTTPYGDQLLTCDWCGGSGRTNRPPVPEREEAT